MGYVESSSETRKGSLPQRGMENDLAPIRVVLPVRAGSERVKNKNTRPFAQHAGGLLELKLKQLAKTPEVDEIIVSSNDPLALAFTEEFARSCGDARIRAVERPDELGRSSTPMSEFLSYVSTLEETGTMCMTHVTHPFISSLHFTELVDAWRRAAQRGHDSMLTVTKLQTFIWDDNGPYNYDPTVEKWPRSQDIKPLYEINHGAYFIPFRTMREVGDRVGRIPFMYELPEDVVLDIDWEGQFTLLEDIARAKEIRGIDII